MKFQHLFAIALVAGMLVAVSASGARSGERSLRICARNNVPSDDEGSKGDGGDGGDESNGGGLLGGLGDGLLGGLSDGLLSELNELLGGLLGDLVEAIEGIFEEDPTATTDDVLSQLDVLGLGSLLSDVDQELLNGLISEILADLRENIEGESEESGARIGSRIGGFRYRGLRNSGEETGSGSTNGRILQPILGQILGSGRRTRQARSGSTGGRIVGSIIGGGRSGGQ